MGLCAHTLWLSSLSFNPPSVFPEHEKRVYTIVTEEAGDAVRRNDKRRWPTHKHVSLALLTSVSMIDTILWGFAVRFYGIGDAVFSFLGVQHDNAEEPSR